MGRTALKVMGEQHLASNQHVHYKTRSALCLQTLLLTKLECYDPDLEKCLNHPQLRVSMYRVLFSHFSPCKRK